MIAEVQGLECDVVVVADASAGRYGDEAEARRALHVACTRAIEQLWVVSVSRPAEILPAAAGERGEGEAQRPRSA